MKKILIKGLIILSALISFQNSAFSRSWNKIDSPEFATDNTLFEDLGIDRRFGDVMQFLGAGRHL